jgi:hypothetical protein
MPLPPGLGTDHEGTPVVSTRRRPADSAAGAEPPTGRRFTTEDLLLQLQQSAAIATEPPPDAPMTADEAEYCEQLAAELGLPDVQVFKSETGQHLALDRRGPEHADQRKIDDLPPVVRAIARGRFGAMLGATSGSSGNTWEATVMNPVILALLETGDGAAETLIASSAVATYTTLGRVLARMNEDLASSPSPQRMAAWESAHAKLRAGLSGDLAALKRIRALRKDWDTELQLVRRRTEDGDHVEVEPRAAH